MRSIILISAICLVICSSNGLPVSYDDIIDAAAAGNLSKVQNLLKERYGRNGLKPVAASGIKTLKPPTGGHFYGHSEYSYYSSSNINGKTSKKSGGHRVINKDGKISEYNW